jgi:hypothetical protein
MFYTNLDIFNKDFMSADPSNNPPSPYDAAIKRVQEGKKSRNETSTEVSSPLKRFSYLKSLQVPLWDDEALAIQFDLTRSALFTSRKRLARKDFKSQTIASLGHLKISYTGEELRQRDYDVYLEILNVARGVNITAENPWIQIDAWALLKVLGWQVNSAGLTELHQTITRLIACKVEISRTEGKGIPGTFYGGGFLHEHAGEHAQDPSQTAHWMVVINTNIASQIQPGQYTKIDRVVRRALSPLGKWLHTFYAGHLNPVPMFLDTIQELAGLGEDKPKTFKYNVRVQLDKLVELNAIQSYFIDDNNKLHVVNFKALSKKKT